MMHICYIATMIAVLLVWGCGRTHTNGEMPPKPVKITVIKEETRKEVVSYIGMVGSKEIKKYAFKIPGKISRIHVEKGSLVSPGTLLAELDEKDVSFAVSDAEHTRRKAQEAYEEANRFYERIAALFEKGAVTADDRDKAKLNRDVREADMRRAEVDVEYKTSVRSDTKMRSEISGYVIEILSKEGEIAGAGYPVVVVRTGRQVVMVGVSQKDVKRLTPGSKAVCMIDGAAIPGKISMIAQIPDLQSRTYTVEISFTGKMPAGDFYLGSVAHVDFELGEKKSVWVPINAIASDGQEYVYVEKEGFAERRTITLGAVSNSFVEVAGLASGDRLIVEGMKDVRQGMRVAAIQ